MSNGMQTQVLTTSDAAVSAVLDQLDRCKSASWAVAWATPNRVYSAALTHMAKFKRLVVGTHGYGTSPICLGELIKHSPVAIRKGSGPLFHPKLYIFEHSDRYTAIVGSHNLTQGAFERNVEVSTISDFDRGDIAVQDLLTFIEDQARNYSFPVSVAFLQQYEDMYRRVKQQRAEADSLFDPFPSLRAQEARKAAPIYKNWPNWDTWFQAIRKLDVHGVERRLDVLERIREIFRSRSNLLAMDQPDRRRVAGLATRQMVQDDDLDWNYFGDMSNTLRSGTPAFGSLVIDNEQGISAALDLIPSHHQVTRQDWHDYWSALKAVAGESGGIGIGSATRLACVKRPDYFVPVNEKNKKQLAALLSVPTSHLDDAAAYWDTVIVPMQLTRWYASAPPSDPLQHRAWLARAALLDCLVYERKS